MVRRLSVIIATANGEQEYVAAAENESMEVEETIVLTPSPNVSNKNETASTENDAQPSTTTSPNTREETDRESTDSSNLSTIHRPVTLAGNLGQEKRSVSFGNRRKRQ